MRESPVPRVSFASEDDADDNDGDGDNFDLNDLFPENNAQSLVDINDSSIGSAEFISISMDDTHFDEQNESELTAADETEQKDPLNEVAMDEAQRSALHSIFGARTQIQVGPTAQTEGVEAADKHTIDANIDANNGQIFESDRSGTYD